MSDETPSKEPPCDGELLPMEALGDLPEKLKQLPQRQRDEVIREVRVIAARSFQGPFPPPWMLDDYERHHPGFLSELMARSAEAQHHAQDMERLEAEGTIRTVSRGQWMGFVFLGGVLVVSAIGIVLHEPLAAGAFAVLAGVVGSLGTRSQSAKQITRRHRHPSPRLSRPPGPARAAAVVDPTLITDTHALRA